MSETLPNNMNEDVDVNARDSRGNTPLHAIKIDSLKGPQVTQCIEIIKNLLAHGANTEARNKKGETPLHSFFRNNTGDYPEVVKIFLDAGADVNAIAHNPKSGAEAAEGFTPLSYSVYSHPKSSILLLEHGANPNVKCYPPELTTAYSNVEEYNMLTISLVHSLSRDPDLELTRKLIEKGININTPPKDRHEALCHVALRISNMDTKLALTMIENGLDLTITNARRGENLLHLAVHYNDLVMAQAVIDKGINLKATNIFGDTPLQLAQIKESNRNRENESEEDRLENDRSAILALLEAAEKAQGVSSTINEATANPVIERGKEVA